MPNAIEDALSTDAKARAATAVGNATTTDGGVPPQPVMPKPRVPRMKDFTIDISVNEERFVGTFTNQILTVGQHSMRGSLAASLAVGQPYETLDPYTREWNEKVAHLRVSLVKMPDWFKDIAGILYPELVDAVYVEVAAHERMFRGLDSGV